MRRRFRRAVRTATRGVAQVSVVLSLLTVFVARFDNYSFVFNFPTMKKLTTKIPLSTVHVAAIIIVSACLILSSLPPSLPPFQRP